MTPTTIGAPYGLLGKDDKMRITKAILMAASAAAVLAANPAQAQQADQDSAVYNLECGRACLLKTLTEYMDALRAKSPGAAPMAENAVFTENNVIIPHGKGVWGTVEKVDKVGLELADPQTQNAAWFGSIIENGKPVIYAVRVHIENGKIDEVESVVHRLSLLPTPFGDTTKLVHFPEFGEVLPPAERRPRERLRAIADAYFDTVELNDGQVFAPFADDCGRTENAMSTTTTTRDNGGSSGLVDGCEAQFKMGYFKINKRVRERTYKLIDEERGIVVATGFFDHANEWDRFLLTDGREMKTWLKWPNTITLLEAFRIKDAEISRIEAVFTYVPYGMHNPLHSQATTPPVPVSSAADCNTACLTGLAGKVSKAFAERGAWKSLPWAEKVGYDENSVGMQVNEGAWGSVTAIDAKPLVIADEQLGRALWIGKMEDHGTPNWTALTVSADGDKIGRIDTLVRRKEYVGPYDATTAAPSFAVLPAGQRASRAPMLAAVDRYYQAVANRSAAAPADIAANCKVTIDGQAVDTCAKPFTQQLRQALEQVRDREVIAVEEARGLVAVSAYEDYTGSAQTFTDTSGAAYKDSLPFPRTLQVVDLFRLEGGKIAGIQSYTVELPYGMKPR
jgi:hypothetical protein